MAQYIRLHPDLWTVDFNSQAICALVSEDEGTTMHLAGEFRTTGDFIAAWFRSFETRQHGYSVYPYNPDYTGVQYSFTIEYGDNVVRYDDAEQQPTLTVTLSDGTTLYVLLGFQGVKHESSDSFVSDTGTVTLSNKWIKPDTVTVTYTDDAGEVQTDAVFGEDYDMDYPRGIFYLGDGKIPYNSDVVIEYEYFTHERYTFDFDNLYAGDRLDNFIKVDQTQIASIMLPVTSPDYVEGSMVYTGTSASFDIWLRDIEIINGDIGEIPTALATVPYRLAEGYDDECTKNPKRLVDSMTLLGYTKIMNFYIGASHFYVKQGEAGVVSVDDTDMILDSTKGVNHAYEVWYKAFALALAEAGYSEFVVSISMENLHMPYEWKQLMYDGIPGQSGWEPPTSFYSPTNTDIQDWITVIANETIEPIREAGLQPSLQLGESWWWWQEFVPGDVNTPYEGRPPCLYDEATKERFLNDMGYELPVYDTSEVPMTAQTREIARKLRDYLGEYTNFMKSLAVAHDVPFTTLFFPPSVLDVSRVPEFIQIINYPKSYWQMPNLDFIQIEDYDWVTEENPQHNRSFEFPFTELGYPPERQHYFSGFVLLAEQAEEQWPLIERAAQQALGRHYAEVFIWAGTQIRRDSWIPTLNTVVTDYDHVYNCIEEEK